MWNQSIGHTVKVMNYCQQPVVVSCLKFPTNENLEGQTKVIFWKRSLK